MQSTIATILFSMIAGLGAANVVALVSLLMVEAGKAKQTAPSKREVTVQ